MGEEIRDSVPHGSPKRRCVICGNLNWFCRCGLEDEDPLVVQMVLDMRQGDRFAMSQEQRVAYMIEGVIDPERMLNSIERAAMIVKTEQEIEEMVGG